MKGDGRTSPEPQREKGKGTEVSRSGWHRRNMMTLCRERPRKRACQERLRDLEDSSTGGRGWI